MPMSGCGGIMCAIVADGGGTTTTTGEACRCYRALSAGERPPSVFAGTPASPTPRTPNTANRAKRFSHVQFHVNFNNMSHVSCSIPPLLITLLDSVFISSQSEDSFMSFISGA